MSLILRLVLMVLFSPFLVMGRLLGLGHPNMAYLPEDHPEMAKAAADARATLPEFRRLLAAPEPGMASFSVKVRYPVPGGGSEHIWVDNLEARGNGFTGKLANRPERLHGLILGSTVDVTDDMISDWAYSKDGVYQGHFTTKVLLPRMNKKMKERVNRVYGWAKAKVA